MPLCGVVFVGWTTLVVSHGLFGELGRVHLQLVVLDLPAKWLGFCNALGIVYRILKCEIILFRGLKIVGIC